MARVKSGIETLKDDGWKRLDGLKIGLVTNPTGILPDRSANIEALRAATNVKLVALFGPEHGVRGGTPAGKYVASTMDPKTGLPEYSLYGPTKVPNAAMLKGLDALVFDIQDIGARSYTYISTLGCVIEGAAKNGIPLIVLDRPNPVGLNRTEGGPTQAGFVSFVSKYPVGYLHGMTLGEFAQMANGMGWTGPKKCDLTVIPCANLTRNMATWESFGGLPWVRTSPNVPRATSPHFYAATGIVGELSALSIGIGTDLQFELAGAPGLDSRRFATMLNDRHIVGVNFIPFAWTPEKGVYSGKRCTGVRVLFTDPATAPLTRLNFELMAAARTLTPNRSFFTGGESTRMFDLSCGTDTVRRAFQSGASADAVWSQFNQGIEAFHAARQAFLLYR